MIEKSDQIKSAVKAVCAFLGISISDETAELIGLVVFFGSLCVTSVLIAHSAVLWIRRKLGDPRAISDEQLAVVKLIKTDIEGIKRTVSHIGSAMNENLQSQMQTLSTQIVEVSNSPAPVEEVEATTERRSVRMFFAEEVQATVLEKFESGQWFVEDRDFHHNFVFDGTSASGSHFVIKLMTPYRQPHQPDGLHDYVLEVRVDDRRAMRFEWDAEEGRPSKLFLSRSRAWIDDIKSWNFQKPPRPHSKPALQAAE